MHPSLIELKKSLKNKYENRKANVILTYVTSRGLWYNYSWKGVNEKSGGIATNIGVHFFDLLIWLFGDVQESLVHISTPSRTSGFIELKNANVQWFLSINKEDLPLQAINKGKSTFRSVTVDGVEIEFSDGFTDLHTRVYEETLAGNGFGLDEARPSIQLVHEIKNSKLSNNKDYVHPFVSKILEINKGKE